MTMPTTERSERFPATPQETCCPIVELRQYTTYPGKRDELINLFDREFVESQEALGMKVIGQFRDLENPDRFVWLRGFSDMPSRAPALQEFYGGPVWKAHREAANATMVDSDNVLLLRPARPASGFSLGNSDRSSLATTAAPILANIYYFDAPVTSDFLDSFEQSIEPPVSDTGASVLACFVTEGSTNNFPALPVREGESVFVWFAAFKNQAAATAHLATLSQWPKFPEALARSLKRPSEVLQLSPTSRSLLHG